MIAARRADLLRRIPPARSKPKLAGIGHLLLSIPLCASLPRLTSLGKNIMTKSALLLGSVLALCFAATASAAIYSQNFETDTTGSWNVNKGPSNTDEAHNFFFDYSTVGIPAAPSGPGTRGLKLQANQSSGVFGGVSVSPIGVNAGSQYKLTFDWWANYNGPLNGGGNGSTQLSTFGVGTSGTVAQWPGGTQDSIWFGATGDGGSSQDWRAYSPTAPTQYAAGTATSNPIFAAPFNASFSDNRNGNHPYYAGFGGNAAPAGQLTLYSQQTGTTGAGSAGMEWHEVVIEKDATNVTWTVDGLLIATVPVAHDTAAVGNNIFFGHSDINMFSSSDVNDVNLLFTLIDNVVVVPESSWIAAFGATLCVAAAIWGGRRR